MVKYITMTDEENASWDDYVHNLRGDGVGDPPGDPAEGAWDRHHRAEVGDIAAFLEDGLPPWFDKPATLAYCITT